jgi:YVTN family beta-propeller protein
MIFRLVSALLLSSAIPAFAGQAPGAADTPDIAISHRDRFYTSDQFSNTVSVIDPMDDKPLGVLRLGDQTPANLSPLYKGQLLVHGMGFSPDHRTLAVVSIGSNSVTFVDTATNAIRHVAYVGRSPHEAFFTPDGKEVWVTVRGEDYVAVLDGTSFRETTRINVPNGPGMTIFSPDGQYGYVCSSFTPETVVITTGDHRIVGHVKQESPFCPDIAATPDGRQVWLTLKDIGKTMVFGARPPFDVIRVIDTGPITNHVNFARNARGQFAYVTIGGLNVVRVFNTGTFDQIAVIPTDALPHGIWPSGDGTRMYVGLENADAAAVIDTIENKVVTTIAIGQAPQGVAYVPNAVPQGDGMQSLQPLGTAAKSVQVTLGTRAGKPATQVTLFDQGIVQILQAAVAGLPAGQPFVLALSNDPKGTGPLEALAGFVTNPAGAAIVNSVGPIRQVMQGDGPAPRRYLVIAAGTPAQPGELVQVQTQP